VVWSSKSVAGLTNPTQVVYNVMSGPNADRFKSKTIDIRFSSSHGRTAKEGCRHLLQNSFRQNRCMPVGSLPVILKHEN
jgi:hypothetical protein